MYLGVVLPMVVAGNKTAPEVGSAVAKIEQEFGAVSAAMFPDHQRGLQLLKEFEAKYPPLANNPAILRAKLSLLPQVGQVDEAKKVAEAVVAKAIQQDNPDSLRQVAALLRNGPGKESKELLTVAVKAAKAAVHMTDAKDARTLLDLAQTYFVVGDTPRAREYAQRAVEAVTGGSTPLRQYIERQARKIDGETHEDKK
jgi:tetratricopeptide (TPR) repeat protein